MDPWLIVFVANTVVNWLFIFSAYCAVKFPFDNEIPGIGLKLKLPPIIGCERVVPPEIPIFEGDATFGFKITSSLRSYKVTAQSTGPETLVYATPWEIPFKKNSIEEFERFKETPIISPALKSDP